MFSGLSKVLNSPLGNIASNTTNTLVTGLGVTGGSQLSTDSALATMQSLTDQTNKLAIEEGEMGMQKGLFAAISKMMKELGDMAKELA